MTGAQAARRVPLMLGFGSQMAPRSPVEKEWRRGFRFSAQEAWRFMAGADIRCEGGTHEAANFFGHA